MSEAALWRLSLKSMPYVSVVIPCRNEEPFIRRVLKSLAHQYDSERYEIIVADGMSTDNTRHMVAEFMRVNPGVEVRLIENPAIHISAGLNTAIRQAKGDIIVRMDGHSIPSANYVRRCVEVLETLGVEVTGAPIQIHPGAETPTARAIAWAVGHPFGIGDARYRLQSSSPQLVDTVAFGAFRKSLWKELGGFNETLLTNEDYDFYYRVRQRGGRIYLDTEAYSIYVARPTLRKLADQYFRYGLWKVQMLRLHPRSIRWRHLVPPGFVAGFVIFTILSLFWPVARWAFLLAAMAYGLLSAFFALRLAMQNKDFAPLLAVPAAFFTIHSSWGGGFFAGLLWLLYRQAARFEDQGNRRKSR